MHDFGKLTAREVVFDITLPDGTVVKNSPHFAFFDKNDVEWHELYQSFEKFDYYVAVNDLDRVVSMEADPEQSQIQGYRIIGMSASEVGDFTNGPGGSVYGKLFDGSTIRDPGLSWAEYPELTHRQLWLAGLEVGIREEDALALINSIPDSHQREAAMIEFTKSSTVSRNHPLVLALLNGVGLAPHEADALWLWAASS